MLHNPQTGFDAVSFIIAFEDGELGEDEVVAGFQELINSGLVWQLEGFYGRTATALIKSGYCIVRGRA